MTLVVYGKPDCCLCDRALAVVVDLRYESGFEVEYVDITEDPALFARYRDAIPVVLLDGVEIARGRVTRSGVRAALAATTRRYPV